MVIKQWKRQKTIYVIQVSRKREATKEKPSSGILLDCPSRQNKEKQKFSKKTFLQTRSHATEMRANGILPDVWTRNGSKTSTSPQAIWIQPYAAGQFYSLEALHPDSLSATKHQSWNRKKDPCIISIYPIKVLSKKKLFSGDRNPHLL